MTVVQPVTGISPSESSCRLANIGEYQQLLAQVQPEDATNKTVRWSSSNEAVCIVSAGRVVATGFGTAVVFATTEDGGFMASCTVVVEKDQVTVSSVELSQTTATMATSEMLQLTAKVFPDDATNKALIWKSSNEQVCMVSQTGLVIAVQEGEAVITVTPEIGSGQAQCAIVVDNELSGITDVRLDEPSDRVVYDAMGHRARELVKGRLYIVNGQKFIAR